MAVKTITVTEDAYDTISRMKEADESFSELFKRIGKKQLTAEDVIGALKQTPAEARAFRERVRAVHEGIGVGLEGNIDHVRARLKRSH